MYYTADKLPNEGVVVETLSENGQTADLLYEKGLWWLPDRSMYVYYSPKVWSYK